MGRDWGVKASGKIKGNATGCRWGTEVFGEAKGEATRCERRPSRWAEFPGAVALGAGGAVGQCIGRGRGIRQGRGPRLKVRRHGASPGAKASGESTEREGWDEALGKAVDKAMGRGRGAKSSG